MQAPQLQKFATSLGKEGVSPGLPTSAHVICGLCLESSVVQAHRDTERDLAAVKKTRFWSSVETSSNNAKRFSLIWKKEEEEEGVWAVSKPAPISLDF